MIYKWYFALSLNMDGLVMIMSDCDLVTTVESLYEFLVRRINDIKSVCTQTTKCRQETNLKCIQNQSVHETSHPDHNTLLNSSVKRKVLKCM